MRTARMFGRRAKKTGRGGMKKKENRGKREGEGCGREGRGHTPQASSMKRSRYMKRAAFTSATNVGLLPRDPAPAADGPGEARRLLEEEEGCSAKAGGLRSTWHICAASGGRRGRRRG